MIGKLYVTEERQGVLEIIDVGTEQEKNSLIDCACATLSKDFKGEVKYPLDVQVLEKFSDNPWLSYWMLFYLHDPRQIIIYPASAKPQGWTWRKLMEIMNMGKFLPTVDIGARVKIIRVE